jgi:hypothetical protein
MKVSRIAGGSYNTKKHNTKKNRALPKQARFRAVLVLASS